MMKTVKIKEIGKVVTGSTPSTRCPEFFGDAYPFIKPSDITPLIRRVFSTETMLSEVGKHDQRTRLLPKNTTSVVCIGTIGKLCLTSRTSFTNQQLNSVIPDAEHFDPIYIFYLFLTIIPKLQKLQGGSASGREHVNKSNFQDIELNVHDLRTQRKIASILSAYDDLIENNTRRIAILEEMAQAIYREWFVNFRFPGHENVKLVDSPMGKIPEGWTTAKMGAVLDIRYGKNLPTNQVLTEGEYPVYGAGGIIGYYDSCICQAKTALVTCRENGSGTIWRTREAAFVTNNSFYITPLPQYSHWSYGFNEVHLKHSNVAAAISGSDQPQITIDGLSQVRFIVPKTSVVYAFTLLIDEFNDMIDTLVRKNNNLRTTRDMLLPKLISGKLDVEDLDINVGMTADASEETTA